MGYKVEFLFCDERFNKPLKHPMAMSLIPRIGEEVFVQYEDGDDAVLLVSNVRYIPESVTTVLIYLSMSV